MEPTDVPAQMTRPVATSHALIPLKYGGVSSDAGCGAVRWCSSCFASAV